VTVREFVGSLGFVLGALAAVVAGSGCATSPAAKPGVTADDARLVLQYAAKTCDAYRRAVAAGDIPADKYTDEACSLLLAPVTE
jgi:hypothetical protein